VRGEKEKKKKWARRPLSPPLHSRESLESLYSAVNRGKEKEEKKKRRKEGKNPARHHRTRLSSWVKVSKAGLGEGG